MPIFSVIAFSALVIAMVSIFFAIRGKYQFYWACAFGIFIFSFLAGFSIGQMTVGLIFIPITMAIGHSFGWIKSKIQSAIFLCLGVLIGFLWLFMSVTCYSTPYFHC